jgi:hypothetical protein
MKEILNTRFVEVGSSFSILADYDGAANRDEYMSKVEESINILPNIGKARASSLLALADNPLPPQELAAKVLPFNFR